MTKNTNTVLGASIPLSRTIPVCIHEYFNINKRKCWRLGHRGRFCILKFFSPRVIAVITLNNTAELLWQHTSNRKYWKITNKIGLTVYYKPNTNINEIRFCTYMNILIWINAYGGRGDGCGDGYYTMNAICGTSVVVYRGDCGSSVNLLTVPGLCVSIGSGA